MINNVGKCCDFKDHEHVDGGGLVEVQKQGYKITGISLGLRADDFIYDLRENFGQGQETNFARAHQVTAIYDCPVNANANIQMAQGGRRKKYRKSRKHRKSKKSTRKASKKSRRH